MNNSGFTLLHTIYINNITMATIHINITMATIRVKINAAIPYKTKFWQEEIW